MYKVDLIYLEPTEPDVTGDAADANRAKNRALLSAELTDAQCIYAGPYDGSSLDTGLAVRSGWRQGIFDSVVNGLPWTYGATEEYSREDKYVGANVHVRHAGKHVAFVRIRVADTTEETEEEPDK